MKGKSKLEFAFTSASTSAGHVHFIETAGFSCFKIGSHFLKLKTIYYIRDKWALSKLFDHSKSPATPAMT